MISKFGGGIESKWEGDHGKGGRRARDEMWFMLRARKGGEAFDIARLHDANINFKISCFISVTTCCSQKPLTISQGVAISGRRALVDSNEYLVSDFYNPHAQAPSLSSVSDHQI